MDIVRTKPGNLRLAWLGELSLTVLEKTVDASEWREMLALAQAHRKNKPTTIALLITRNGASIGAEHRRLTAELSAGSAPMKAIAMATDSTVTRGALAAYGWLVHGPTQYKAFSIGEVHAAITWLNRISPFDTAAAKALLDELMAPGAAA